MWNLTFRVLLFSLALLCSSSQNEDYCSQYCGNRTIYNIIRTSRRNLGIPCHCRHEIFTSRNSEKRHSNY
ncbi:hypothetical protein X975_02114, partial [Stegodyphus mimosarum]